MPFNKSKNKFDPNGGWMQNVAEAVGDWIDNLNNMKSSRYRNRYSLFVKEF